MTKKMLIADGVGVRLREERERLGLNQLEFGTMVGVSRGTQKNYELGANSLDLRYVATLTEHKIDAGYVLTGRRSPSPQDGLTPDEEDLIEQYRILPENDKKSIHRYVVALSVMAKQDQK